MARMFKNKANTTCKAKSIDVVEDKVYPRRVGTFEPTAIVDG